MIRSTFALPVLIALASLFGLVLALTGDGWRDAVACFALATTVIATAIAFAAARFKQKDLP